jgi:hypothetical protein
MRRAILRPEVGLDLDDPAHASAGGVVAHEASADQGTAGIERRTGEDGPIDDAQRNG